MTLKNFVLLWIYSFTNIELFHRYIFKDFAKIKTNKKIKTFKKTFWPIFMDGFQLLQGYYKEAVYFLVLSSQEILVLIWSTSQGWKAGLTLAPPNSFEPNRSFCF